MVKQYRKRVVFKQADIHCAGLFLEYRRGSKIIFKPINPGIQWTTDTGTLLDSVHEIFLQKYIDAYFLRCYGADSTGADYSGNDR
jgi:hypothetical protein